MDMFNLSFSDVEWGEDDAKNDNLLDLYFVEFPGYNYILTGEKRFIIGRKGTGKSAILQKIRLKTKNEPTFFCTDISLRDFPLNDFKALGERGLQDKAKYVSAWKFILLTELSNMIIQDNSIEETEELDILKKFLKDNFPEGISVAETIGRLRQNENKIAIAMSILSGESSDFSGTETTSRIHYNKAVKALENLLAKFQSQSTYFMLIDELDEGYRARNSNLNVVILALLRAADELYNFFKKESVNCIPVTALRSDIFDNLEDNDLNKLDDFVLRLNWTTAEKDPWSLKQIVERRIEITLKNKFPQAPTCDYWNLVAVDSSIPKGLWQYICTLTFSRPRDIIKLLKYCSSSLKSGKLTLNEVQSIEERYSDWFYREFRDEAQSFLSCWKGALNSVSEVAKGKERIDILLQRLDDNEEVKNWCSTSGKKSMDVVKTLFDYSVIGCINESGRWIFKYKDDYFEFMQSYPYYCVHFGFCRKLRIPKSYDRQILDANSSYN